MASMIAEEALTFDCGGDTLIGVVAMPRDTPAAVGVLIVVGGPQYRAGSHRQFTLLSRFLAEHGLGCMRFDYRGMGDSTGSERGFEGVGDDIAAAIDAFTMHVPAVKHVVLWGLCDGASAACFRAPLDERVAGLVLLNPWVRTEAGQAKAMLKHYYLGRLLDKRFWQKLLSGGVGLRESIRNLWANIASSTGGSIAQTKNAGTGSVSALPDRVLSALKACSLPFVVFLSGRDYVAKEFEEVLAGSADWRGLFECPRVSVVRFDSADHTFSGAERRDAVSRATLQWIVSQGLVDPRRD